MKTPWYSCLLSWEKYLYQVYALVSTPLNHKTDFFLFLSYILVVCAFLSHWLYHSKTTMNENKVLLSSLPHYIFHTSPVFSIHKPDLLIIISQLILFVLSSRSFVLIVSLQIESDRTYSSDKAVVYYHTSARTAAVLESSKNLTWFVIDWGIATAW